ncbi:unnamed protein product, partial [Ectocarpus fasciculatus]
RGPVYTDTCCCCAPRRVDSHPAVVGRACGFPLFWTACILSGVSLCRTSYWKNMLFSVALADVWMCICGYRRLASVAVPCCIPQTGGSYRACSSPEVCVFGGSNVKPSDRLFFFLL